MNPRVTGVVDLSENLLYIFEEIAGCPRTRELNVSGNSISNPTGIGNFTALESLDLTATAISTLEHFDLIHAGLQRLSLARTGVSDLGPRTPGRRR